MDQRLNILFLPRWYPDRYDPMPGLFIRRQAEAASAFCNVAVLYAREDPAATVRYERVITEENNVRVVRIYYRPLRTSIRVLDRMIGGVRYFRAVMKGFRSLRNFGPDLVHVHVLTRGGVMALWHNTFHGVPFIVTEHWSRYFPENDTFQGACRIRMTKKVLGETSALVTVSGRLLEAMKNRGLTSVKERIIPNPVDTNRFRILPNERLRDRRLKRMIHISCFEDRSKNISGFLEVLKEIVAQRDDFTCTLVGEGPDLEAMKRKAVVLGLADRFVTFPGLAEEGELVTLINRADFLVLSSRYETFGTVIIEALSCGIPVVSTDVGIAGTVINPSNGILCPAGDPAALKASLIKMLDTCRTYDPGTIRTGVTDKFGMKEVGERLLGLYRECL